MRRALLISALLLAGCAAPVPVQVPVSEVVDATPSVPAPAPASHASSGRAPAKAAPAAAVPAAGHPQPQAPAAAQPAEAEPSSQAPAPAPAKAAPTPAAPTPAPAAAEPTPDKPLPPCPTTILFPGAPDQPHRTDCSGEQVIIDCRKPGNPHPQCEGIHGPGIIPPSDAPILKQF